MKKRLLLLLALGGWGAQLPAVTLAEYADQVIEEMDEAADAAEEWADVVREAVEWEDERGAHRRELQLLLDADFAGFRMIMVTQQLQPKGVLQTFKAGKVVRGKNAGRLHGEAIRQEIADTIRLWKAAPEGEILGEASEDEDFEGDEEEVEEIADLEQEVSDLEEDVMAAEADLSVVAAELREEILRELRRPLGEVTPETRLTLQVLLGDIQRGKSEKQLAKAAAQLRRLLGPQARTRAAGARGKK